MKIKIIEMKQHGYMVVIPYISSIISPFIQRIVCPLMEFLDKSLCLGLIYSRRLYGWVPIGHDILFVLFYMGYCWYRGTLLDCFITLCRHVAILEMHCLDFLQENTLQGAWLADSPCCCHRCLLACWSHTSMTGNSRVMGLVRSCRRRTVAWRLPLRLTEIVLETCWNLSVFPPNLPSPSPFTVTTHALPWRVSQSLCVLFPLLFLYGHFSPVNLLHELSCFCPCFWEDLHWDKE